MVISMWQYNIADVQLVTSLSVLDLGFYKGTKKYSDPLDHYILLSQK